MRLKNKKIMLLNAGKKGLNVIYALFCIFPRKEKAVMISRQGNRPGMDFLLLKKELKKQYPKLTVVMLCHTLDGGANSGMGTRIRYGFHMIRQLWHLAAARVAILDTYCMAVSLLTDKRGLKVLQIWHSMGTMKLFGYTAVDTAEGTSRELADAMCMHKNYDAVLCSGEAYRKDLAAGFACDPAIIQIHPLPRVDLLTGRAYHEKTRKRIFEAYPELRGKPVVLYAPTFRKDETDFIPALKKLVAAWKPERCNLVVKLHFLSRAKVPEGVMTCPDFSSFELLTAADALISDFSCIIYEAAVKEIPLFFYNFDMDLYRQGRGLAIDYEQELPGPISPDADRVMEAVEEELKTGSYDRKRLKAFSQKYVRPTDGAAKEIVDMIGPWIRGEGSK